jgi:hypothetical protein
MLPRAARSEAAHGRGSAPWTRSDCQARGGEPNRPSAACRRRLGRAQARLSSVPRSTGERCPGEPVLAPQATPPCARPARRLRPRAAAAAAAAHEPAASCGHLGWRRGLCRGAWWCRRAAAHAAAAARAVAAAAATGLCAARRHGVGSAVLIDSVPLNARLETGVVSFFQTRCGPCGACVLRRCGGLCGVPMTP